MPASGLCVWLKATVLRKKGAGELTATSESSAEGRDQKSAEETVGRRAPEHGERRSAGATLSLPPGPSIPPCESAPP